MMFGVGAVKKRDMIESIHRDDVVEAFEIVIGHASRPNISERISTTLCSSLSAAIWRFTDVIRMCARRIDFDVVCESGRIHAVTKNTFGSRRSADVAHADK